MSFLKSIYLIHLVYGVVGSIGLGLIYMPAVIAVGFYFEKWRGLATGIATCGTGLGGVAQPIVLTMIQERLGELNKHWKVIANRIKIRPWNKRSHGLIGITSILSFILASYIKFGESCLVREI